VADRLRAALAHRTGREVGALDPNERLVRDVTRRLASRGLRFHAGFDRRADDGAHVTGPGSITVEVISKVELDEGSREGIAALIDPVSPRTARALRGYLHEPGLF
jgi:hypothetical protein